MYLNPIESLLLGNVASRDRLNNPIQSKTDMSEGSRFRMRAFDKQIVLELNHESYDVEALTALCCVLSLLLFL